MAFASSFTTFQLQICIFPFANTKFTIRFQSCMLLYCEAVFNPSNQFSGHCHWIIIAIHHTCIILTQFSAPCPILRLLIIVTSFVICAALHRLCLPRIFLPVTSVPDLMNIILRFNLIELEYRKLMSRSSNCSESESNITHVKMGASNNSRNFKSFDIFVNPKLPPRDVDHPGTTTTDTSTVAFTREALSHAVSLPDRFLVYFSSIGDCKAMYRRPLLILNSSSGVICLYVIAQLSKVHRSSSVLDNRHKTTSSDDIRRP